MPERIQIMEFITLQDDHLYDINIFETDKFYLGMEILCTTNLLFCIISKSVLNVQCT